MAEYVYLMRAGVAYKIGRTNNIPRRLIELTEEARSRYKERPVLVHTIETRNSRAIESQLKRIFKPWQDRGEWYFLSVYSVAWICQQGDPLDDAPDMHVIAVAEEEMARRDREADITLFTPKEAARVLGIEERAVLHWMSTGGIDFVTIGWRSKRIRLTELRRIKKILDN